MAQRKRTKNYDYTPKAAKGLAKRLPTGRPGEYHPTYCEFATNYCLLGCTDEQLAAFCSITVETLHQWKAKYPAFSDAIKSGKEIADANVAKSLFHRANGYSHEAVKIFLPAGSRKPVYAKYDEMYPPDTTAAIYWLKNRRGGEWRRDQEGAPAQATTVTVNVSYDAALERVLQMIIGDEPDLIEGTARPVE